MAESIQTAAEVKTAHVLSFLYPLLSTHFSRSSTPFLLGLNGIQGAGKTTLVKHVASALRSQHGFPTAVLSIDDLYLPHAQQQALARRHAKNPLVQHRGQPGTHDVQLGLKTLQSLRDGKRTRVPAYDKSAFNGEGDRVDEKEWEVVNESESEVKIVVLEGWCVGFRPLEMAQMRSKWEEATRERKEGRYDGRLGWNTLESVEFVNKCLQEYDQLTDSFNALVHIDAADTRWVYDWRLEQEQMLIKDKGSGMTKEQVKMFVDGYYPAYELFYEKLRQGIFGEPGKQLRLIVGRDRGVLEVVNI